MRLWVGWVGVWGVGARGAGGSWAWAAPLKKARAVCAINGSPPTRARAPSTPPPPGSQFWVWVGRLRDDLGTPHIPFKEQ